MPVRATPIFLHSPEVEALQAVGGGHSRIRCLQQAPRRLDKGRPLTTAGFLGRRGRWVAGKQEQVMSRLAAPPAPRPSPGRGSLSRPPEPPWHTPALPAPQPSLSRMKRALSLRVTLEVAFPTCCCANLLCCLGSQCPQDGGQPAHTNLTLGPPVSA